MNFWEFNRLNEYQKQAAVRQHAVRIADRYDQTVHYVLYQFEAFYAEVWFMRHEHTVLKIRSFDTTGPLDPYLKGITIHIDY